jgi:pyruvate dehydrogenase E1 component alpha subunit
MLGANGIVGGGPPLVCGAALAAKVLGNNRVAVAFVGDGGSNQGTTFESLNLAKVWNLPAIFVVENNGYAEATSVKYSVAAADSIAERASGFGMPAVSVNRYYGHFEGDAQTYRPPDEVKKLRELRDCIDKFAQAIMETPGVSKATLEGIDQDVGDLIDYSVSAAKSDPRPGTEDLLTDVYSSY